MLDAASPALNRLKEITLLELLEARRAHQMLGDGGVAGNIVLLPNL